MYIFKTCSTKNVFLGRKCFQHTKVRQRKTSSSATAIFIEKTFEEPCISVSEKECVDFIGPPDPISNLRPVIRGVLHNETTLQQKLRKMQLETQAWNQKFWLVHNTKFIQERSEFVRKHLGGNKDTLSADEMSEFYRKFLNENWEAHVKYNFEWYGRNFRILAVACKAQLQSALRLF